MNSRMNNTYLKDNRLWLGNKTGSFELSASYNLWLNYSFLLSYHGFSHIFLLQNRKLWLVVPISDLINNILLPCSLLLCRLSILKF